MEGLNLTRVKFVYVRNKNRYGDVQGILFEMDKDWRWVQAQSTTQIKGNDFCNLVKNICDLRGVTANGLPIDMSDIHIAIASMSESVESTSTRDLYETDDNGFLVHKKTGDKYISSYGCSCIIEHNKEAKRPTSRGYRTGITASKAVIRTLTPLGYWKTAKICDDTEWWVDDHALYECANDFLAEGNHHKVKGYIPTEVFQMSRQMEFVFQKTDDV